MKDFIIAESISKTAAHETSQPRLWGGGGGGGGEGVGGRGEASQTFHSTTPLHSFFSVSWNRQMLGWQPGNEARKTKMGVESGE